jgi:sulfur-oxidizing protein SoxY
MMSITRRTMLHGLAGLPVLLTSAPVLATTQGMAQAMLEFTGGVSPVEQFVVLDIPALVENGNSVPLGIRVDRPMLPDDFVSEIAVFNEKNPQPQVARFYLGPHSGRAEVATRIRLGDSQTITVIARTSKGAFFAASATLIVTLPACVEGA